MDKMSDEVKDKLIGVIQSGFPVTERPFQELGERAEMSESEIIGSVNSLIGDETIRVFGPVFEARKLGYISTLMAAEVEPDRVAELAAYMLDIREITHNYLRGHMINLWYTITARNHEIRKKIAKRIEEFPMVAQTLDLPVVKLYKISAVFGAKDHVAAKPVELTTAPEISENEQAVVRVMQDNFPLVERPYNAIAETLGLDEKQVIEIVGRWVDDGTIRRFGARLNHRRAGYSSNMLVAWKGDKIDAYGERFAEMPQITHCYCRKNYSNWPYELYTMVHARSDEEMEETLKIMKGIAFEAKPIMLKSLYELKKTSMKYYMEDAGWDSQ